MSKNYNSQSIKLEASASQSPKTFQRSAMEKVEINNHRQSDFIIFMIVMLFLFSVFYLCGVESFGITQKKKANIYEFGVLENVAFNLKQIPYADIKSINQVPITSQKDNLVSKLLKSNNKKSENLCPDDYEVEKLGFWQGIKEGCICSDGSVHSLYFCSLRADCSKVENIRPIPITSWGNTKICTKKLTGYKFIKGSEECASGEIKCSSRICVNGGSCPITNIKVVESKSDKSGFQITSNNIDQTLEPIINFQVLPSTKPNDQIDYSPCYNDQQLPEFQSKSNYKLLKVPTGGCNESLKSGKEVVLVNTAPALKIYEQNNIWKIYNNLPRVTPIESTDQLNLIAVRRFKLGEDEICSQIKPEQIDQITKEVQYVDNLVFYQTTVAFAISATTIVSALFLFFTRKEVLFQNYIFFFKQKDKVQNIPQTKIWAVISLILALFLLITSVNFINNIMTAGGLKDSCQLFNNYNVKNCFPSDQPIRDSIEKVRSYAYNSYIHYWDIEKTLLGISILLITILPILSIYQIQKGSPAACYDPWNN